MKPAPRVLTSTLLVLLSATAAHASLITFSSRASFNAAAPGLSTETFESGMVTPGGVTTCAGPLSSAASSACFAAGALLPGVTYSSTTGSMVLLGAGFPTVGNASKVIGPNLFADTLTVTFASANAAGFDLFVAPVAGNVNVSFFSPTNQLLGSSLVAVPFGGVFIGAIEDAGLIGHINIAGVAPADAELIDNVTFGTTAASPVPEPSTLLLLTLGLATAASTKRRRQP